MRNLSVFAVSSAIALAFVSVATTAQDRPATEVVKKATASVTSSSKSLKATNASERSSGTSSKGLSERAGARQATPIADRAAPAAAYEGCHGKDSDA